LVRLLVSETGFRTKNSGSLLATYKNTIMKIFKKFAIAFLLVFISINIYWQYDYEQIIKEIKRNCVYIRERQRLKFTPIFIYKLECIFDLQERGKGPKLI
jgi:hypothetical protein